MPEKLQKLLIVALLALAAIIALLVLQAGKAPSAPPLPSPNGYDDFVKAGGMLVGSTPIPDYATISKSELRSLVDRNAEALQLARIGLTRECRVPLDYAGFTNGVHLNDVAHVKGVAQAFAAEGLLAELENRPADAAQSYLTDLRLGQELARGGVIIDSLVGIAVEAIGASRLEKLAPTLDAKQCREVAAALEGVESRRETPDAVLAQEKAWAWRTYGFKGQIAKLATFRSFRKVEQKYVAKATQQQVRIRLLLIQLAARAFELEKGRRPATLAELVPGYLKAIPQDPLTGTNLLYRP